MFKWMFQNAILYHGARDGDAPPHLRHLWGGRSKPMGTGMAQQVAAIMLYWEEKESGVN